MRLTKPLFIYIYTCIRVQVYVCIDIYERLLCYTPRRVVVRGRGCEILSGYDTPNLRIFPNIRVRCKKQGIKGFVVLCCMYGKGKLYWRALKNPRKWGLSRHELV